MFYCPTRAGSTHPLPTPPPGSLPPGRSPALACTLPGPELRDHGSCVAGFTLVRAPKQTTQEAAWLHPTAAAPGDWAARRADGHWETGKREALLPGQPHPPRAREGGPHRCHWPAGRAGGRPCPPPMEQPDMLPVCRGCPTPSARPSVSQGLAKSFRRRLCNSRRGKQMREKKEWGREDKKN